MDTTALLQAIYKAYREKRLADVLSHLADDSASSCICPRMRCPAATGHAARRRPRCCFMASSTTYDFLAYDPGPIIVTGERATAQPQIRYRHKKTGKVMETKLATPGASRTARRARSRSATTLRKCKRS